MGIELYFISAESGSADGFSLDHLVYAQDGPHAWALFKAFVLEHFETAENDILDTKVYECGTGPEEGVIEWDALEGFSRVPFLGLQELKAELRFHWDSGDVWGSAINAQFDCAEELTRRGDGTPASWQFRPGALGVPDPEPGSLGEALRDFTSEAIEALGELLDRLCSIYRAKGLDY